MKLYAVVGEHLPHSLSPQMQEDIMKILGIDGRFVIMEVARENLSKSVDALKTLNVSGVSVTIPYKSEIIPYLDGVSEEAKKLGAVNCVNFKNGKAIGYNTDYTGFGMMLNKAGIEVAGKDIVQIGAGGAGRAVLCYCHDAGAKSQKVFDVDPGRLEQLKKEFPYIETITAEERDAISGDVIINATPIGMSPQVDHMSVEEAVLKRFSAAVDTVYNPVETKFIRTAKANGMKAIGGLYMLLYQGVRAQEIWQERSIDCESMEGVYDNLTKLF